MPQVILSSEGAFDSTLRKQLNAMLTELYASIGASVTLTRTSTGVTTVLPASPVARNVTINVNVTTVFANGDGAQPTLTIGETDTPAKFAAAAAFTNAAVGLKSYTGVLSAGKALIATSVAATGTTSTGAAVVTASGVPA